MTLQQRYDNSESLFSNMIMHQQNVIVAAAKLIVLSRERYQELVAGTKVPWYVPGILHYRESTCNFKTHLHNGDPLSAKTVHVPAGRPLTGKPPFSWEESAKDALFYQKKMDTFQQWTIPVMLYRFESYNGNGYRRTSININSPYVWSYTNHYTAGKFIEDGKYDGRAIDKQVGCAPLLRYLTDKTLGIV